MSKRRRKKKSKTYKPKKKHYDIEMIEDFLDHLLWELRINHLENTNPDMEPHPELCDQLKKYIKKYNTVGLMKAMSIAIEPGKVPEDEKRKAIDMLMKAKAERSQKAIDALETLQTTFQTAFECASNPDSFMIHEINFDELPPFICDEEDN